MDAPHQPYSGSAPPHLEVGGDGLAELEPQQVEDLYRAPSVPLADERAPALRVGVYVGSVLLVLMLAFAALVPVTRRVQAPFEIRGDQREHVVRFFEPVRLLDLHAEVGRAVEPGDPLLEFSAPEAALSATALEEARDRQRTLDATGAGVYRAQMATLEAEARRARREAADIERAKRETWAVYSAELAGLEARADAAARRYARTSDLATRGAVSAAQLEEDRAARAEAANAVEARRAARRAEVAALDARLNAARNDAQLAERRRDEIAARLDEERRSLDAAVVRAERFVTRSFGTAEVTEDGVLVRSPEAGTVSFVYTGGQDVPAGETLMKVLGAPQRLYATAMLSPKEVGLVEEGASAALKMDPYPHYRWGTLEGVVRYVSLTPDAEGRYRCEVTLRTDGGLAVPIHPGMPGTLAIATERRTLLGYLFDRTRAALTDVAP